MEKNQKRRSFMKRLYRAARSGSKAKAKPSNSPASTTSLSSGGSFAVSSELRSANYPNRLAPAPPVQKHASPAQGEGTGEARGGYSGYGGDENVDAKAATYISCVRERLKLERVDWNQKVY